MNKKILAVYYSQTGQLRDIIDCFCEPLIDEGNIVEKVNVKLNKDYPFPWTSEIFFSVMPDCVLGIPTEITSPEFKESSYDLVILGYQAWFLSPSIPFNSIMQLPSLRNILRKTPVITITGARNMWINAFEGVKKLLHSADAILVGNISLVDRHPNLISFVTIFHWMLHGKKDRYLQIFPKPGVSDADISGTKELGVLLLPYLQTHDWRGLQSEFVSRKAIDLKYHLMFIESKAGPIFKLWAKFIVKRKNRSLWLNVFKYYLMFALFVAAPIIYVLDQLFFEPFLPKYIHAKKQLILKLN
jgi:hypothetical protein